MENISQQNGRNNSTKEAAHARPTFNPRSVLAKFHGFEQPFLPRVLYGVIVACVDGPLDNSDDQQCYGWFNGEHWQFLTGHEWAHTFATVPPAYLGRGNWAVITQLEARDGRITTMEVTNRMAQYAMNESVMAEDFVRDQAKACEVKIKGHIDLPSED